MSNIYFWLFQFSNILTNFAPCESHKYIDTSNKILREGVMYGNNWELFSENANGKVIFKSKSDAQKNAALKCIPVYHLDKSKLSTVSTIDDLVKIYKEDTTRCIGFLQYNSKYVSMLSMRLNDDGETRAIGHKYDVSSSVNEVNKYYNFYIANNGCIYFDSSMHTLCTIKGKEIFILDVESGLIINIKDKISQIGGLETFKEYVIDQ